MIDPPSFLESLTVRGLSRRAFLKFCAVTASALALPEQEARSFPTALGAAARPTVIWLSFQQCTGCSESVLRSFTPSLERLILEAISLDYHETLQAAAGYQAERARSDAMRAASGKYILIVDGSIPSGEAEFWSCVAGTSNLSSLREAASNAALVIALGTCASFGGIPAAYPNPSNAAGYGDLIAAGLLDGQYLPPYINLAGCPPLPEVITGTIAHYIAYGSPPPLDALNRPQAYYGQTVHDRCPRLAHHDAGRFALSHGDEGAKQGFCLLQLGCRGPQTYNACTAMGWNMDPADGGAYANSPTHTGHGCLGCSQPRFWDQSHDPATQRFGSFYSTN